MRRTPTTTNRATLISNCDALITAAARMSGSLSEPGEYVTRVSRSAVWNLVRGADTIASAHAMCRPDGRWFVSIDAWDDAAWAPLAAVMIKDLDCDLHTVVDESDGATLASWRRFGFQTARREIDYVIPVDPGVSGLVDSRLPDGMVMLAADAVDETELRLLDDTLRADGPGSDGWLNDPQEFRERSFDERYFDPATYLVALDDAGPAFAGLVRIAVLPRRPRLGLIGVSSGYRRRGLARALLAAAFAALHDRGFTQVSAEVDATNTASVRLLEQIGAERVGASVVLVRQRESR
ncbi:MAG: GNAT family N-acetyltransferase [Pseudonocardiales bacterium]